MPLDLLSIPRLVGVKNVKTFRWDQRLQIYRVTQLRTDGVHCRESAEKYVVIPSLQYAVVVAHGITIHNLPNKSANYDIHTRSVPNRM